MAYDKVIDKHLREELPFMATENILMDAVERGGDRQELHEHIRVHSMAAANAVKMEGKECDLLARIAADPAFGLTREEIEASLEPERYVGRAPRQVELYLQKAVRPLLEANKSFLGKANEITV